MTTPTQTVRLLLSVEQAAERLGIGRTLTYALIRSGEIPSVQIGRLRRIRPSDLETYAAGLAAAPAQAA
jgi:excisionase family DNA binding protein